MSKVEIDMKAAAQSIKTPIRTGYLNKRGEIVKNWKRRYFILVDKALYYYENSTSSQPKGVIALTKECGVRRYESGERGHFFTIRTPGRVYLLEGESADDVHGWIGSIGGCIVRPSTRDYYDADSPYAE